MTNPIAKKKGAQKSIETRGVTPALVKSVQVQKAPSMINSPWAMFKTLATPYCRPKPTAMRAYIPAREQAANRYVQELHNHDGYLLRFTCS